MKGFIEVKEDTYDDTIEHLHRLKSIACKMIKKLAEQSDIYDREKEYEYDDDDYERESRGRMRRSRGRYNY